MNHSNNGFSVLAGAVAPGDAVITLAVGTGARFPASDFLVTLVGYDELGNENKWEICKCSSRTGDVLTVTRAQEGTTASAWPGATRIENRVTAGTMADLEPKIAAGTTAQYQRGDKTWRDFSTDVRAATLTGLSTSTNAAITASDTVLVAHGKLQAQVSDNAANTVKRLDVGASPAQVPSGQHIGRLAHMDELAALRATLTQPQAIGAVWVERVSDTSIKLFMRGNDGVARSTTLTLS